MTAPPPESEPPPGKRRRWLIAVCAAWAVALLVAGVWSFAHDPPTVPDQRAVAAAAPQVRRATGVLMAALDRPGRVVALGGSRLSGCELTPVRGGSEITRDLTLYVPAGRALPVLRELAGALPADWTAHAGGSAGGTRVGFHADAGAFVGVDATGTADAQVLTLRLSTGCRPGAGADLTDPGAPASPAALTALLTALRAPVPPVVRSAPCPDGSVTATYTVDGVPAPADLGVALRRSVSGAEVVRGEPAGWAYRVGGVAIAVVPVDRDGLSVSATVPCG